MGNVKAGVVALALFVAMAMGLKVAEDQIVVVFTDGHENAAEPPTPFAHLTPPGEYVSPDQPATALP
jgi:hypothetical protein